MWAPCMMHVCGRHVGLMQHMHVAVYGLNLEALESDLELAGVESPALVFVQLLKETIDLFHVHLPQRRARR